MIFKKPLCPNGIEIIMVSGKTDREQKRRHSESFMQLFGNLEKVVDLGSDFGAHWILKGVPKLIVLETFKTK